MSETQTPTKEVNTYVNNIGINWATIAKYAAGLFLVVPVLYLTIIGKFDVSNYMAMVVTPGLAFLGYHAASKS